MQLPLTYVLSCVRLSLSFVHGNTSSTDTAYILKHYTTKKNSKKPHQTQVYKKKKNTQKAYQTTTRSVENECVCSTRYRRNKCPGTVR